MRERRGAAPTTVTGVLQEVLGAVPTAGDNIKRSRTEIALEKQEEPSANKQPPPEGADIPMPTKDL